MEKYKIEVKWAFIFIGMSLLWMWLEKLTGLHNQYLYLQQYLTLLFMIPAIWVYVAAMKDKKRNFYHGVMTFQQGFITGLIITVIVTVFTPLTQWFISTIITPDYFPNVIAYTVKTGYYKSVEAATAVFNLKNYIIQSTIAALVMGIVTSALVALFVKSKKTIST